jgi:transposase
VDLSRHRLDVRVLSEDGKTVVDAWPSDADDLGHLVRQVATFGRQANVVIESMNDARFVHDTLELHGWNVEIADAVRARGLAPLARTTDKIDAKVLAELSRRILVPAIWLPNPSVHAEREWARFRLHLVHDRVALNLDSLPNRLIRPEASA